MNPRLEKQIRRAIGLFERDVLTVREAADMIAGAALDPEFFDHLEIIPEQLVTELRRLAEHASGHPEDVFHIRWGGARDAEVEARYREQRNCIYWSDRRLREYFFPGKPLPAFEPIKLVGVVDESIEVEGEIAVFGEIDTFIMRHNPVICVRPDGTKLVTSLSRCDRVRRDVDLESDDSFVRSYGQVGLFFDNNVQSVADVPPQTEVWVDRTAMSEIPDPPVF